MATPSSRTSRTKPHSQEQPLPLVSWGCWRGGGGNGGWEPRGAGRIP